MFYGGLIAATLDRAEGLQSKGGPVPRWLGEPARPGRGLRGRLGHFLLREPRAFSSRARAQGLRRSYPTPDGGWIGVHSNLGYSGSHRTQAISLVSK